MDDFPVELKPEVLKKADELDVKPEDIEETFIKGGGRGGQKINKTSSAVRLKHIPTGIEVKVQKHREQSKNRMSAYKLLIYKIEELIKGEKSEKAKKIYKIKKQKQKRSKRAKEKLLEIKKRRSELKETRKKIKPRSSANNLVPVFIIFCLFSLSGCALFGQPQSEIDSGVKTESEKVEDIMDEIILDEEEKEALEEDEKKEIVEEKQVETPQEKRVDFSEFDRVYRFSAEIPNTYEVEYVPEIRAINIYDLNDSAKTKSEKSQIFLRYFEANSFLTLSTVDIINREETVSHNRPAVIYEITKKPGVADFPNQPSWRNKTHRLIDIRFTSNNPSLFFVNSYNPQLPVEKFDAFIDSIVFHNDEESFALPMAISKERVTKIPFGTKVPEESPIPTDRFSGYHSGTDFEIFKSELEEDVPIFSICGGEFYTKRFAQGYGGFAAQYCLLEDQPIVVIYGHLNLESINHESGDYLQPGTLIGLLGDHESEQTDGERKHLHLGIRKGSEADIRGYVPLEKGLEDFINPETLLFPSS